ncbi:FecR domain-containing protein [Bordetella genomosp. 13]|uniref:FecR domain-containing protein n=1 Tax=Bordetella genomosp. 13 TaxID=463040 RepID=UPI0021B5D0BC|nr:FecR domain-containing protein [Bordetella genomosp. 13]
MEPEFSASPQPPLSDQVVTWLVLLRSGRATPKDYANFLAWRDGNPLHERAWQQLTGTLNSSMLGRLGDNYPAGYEGDTISDSPEASSLLPAAAAGVSLGRRHFLGGAMALGACAVGAAYVGNAYYPLDGLASDAATQTGERRRYMLSDGSQLLLDARSRVDLEYTSSYRMLHLLEGAISVDVQADPTRPFLVRTAEGVVRSLGTRYMVRQQARRTLVVVHEHDVEVETMAGSRMVVPSGTGTRFDNARIGVPRADLMPDAAWEHGWIEANDRPLAEVVAALRPYRQGTLRVSMAAGGLPVRGTYPLDDSDAALRALENTMPIQVSRLTPWFVSINVLST